jgi:hypothetical protein
VGRGVVCCGLCRPAVFFFLVCCVVEKPCVLLAVQTRGGVQCAMRMRNAACSPPAGRRRQRTSHFAVGGRWGLGGRLLFQICTCIASELRGFF